MSKPNRKLICLIGIDGCGKSTHILYFMNNLKNHGVRCKHVVCGAHVRFATLPLYFISGILGLNSKYKNIDRHIHTPLFPEVYRNIVLSAIWPWAVFIDTVIIVFIRIKLSLLTNSVVFSDRYVYDILVETMVVTKNYDLHRTKLGKLFLKLANPFKVIMLDIDENDAFKRKADIPDLEYVQIRRQLYHKIASDFGIAIIDTNRAFEKVHADIARACQLPQDDIQNLGLEVNG